MAAEQNGEDGCGIFLKMCCTRLTLPLPKCFAADFFSSLLGGKRWHWAPKLLVFRWLA
jgi:hypothetical protein